MEVGWFWTDTYLATALSSSSVHLSARLWSCVWIFSRSRVSAVAAILSPSARIISTVGRRSSSSLCSSCRKRHSCLQESPSLKFFVARSCASIVTLYCGNSEVFFCEMFISAHRRLIGQTNSWLTYSICHSIYPFLTTTNQRYFPQGYNH